MFSSEMFTFWRFHFIMMLEEKFMFVNHIFISPSNDEKIIMI